MKAEDPATFRRAVLCPSLCPHPLGTQTAASSQTGAGSLKYLKAFQALGTQHGQEPCPPVPLLEAASGRRSRGRMESQTLRSEVLLTPVSASPISTGHEAGALWSSLASLFQTTGTGA